MMVFEKERAERIGAVLRELEADWAVLTGPAAVCYATGHPVAIEWGPSPFGGGPVLAFVGRSGEVGLLAPNHELPEVAAGVEAETYVGFTADHRADRTANFAQAAKTLAARLGVKGRMAVESASFTVALSDCLSPVATMPIDDPLAKARMVKTAGELALLRRAAEIAATGQETARAACRPGQTELDAFALVRAAMENAAGERCAVAGDFVSGPKRSGSGGGWPIARRMEEDDTIIADLAPRVGGYWGDSCGSFVLGRPGPEYVKAFNAAKEALRMALSAMRPGLPISRLDEIVREPMRATGHAYTHHSGHSIGAAVHEYPRIVPYEDLSLQENMVLMVEPGAYVPGRFGVRLEWMIRVTARGAEPMAPFAHEPVAGTGGS